METKQEEVIDKKFLENAIKSSDPRLELIRNEAGKSHVWSRFARIKLDGNIVSYVACLNCKIIFTYLPKSGTGALLRHNCTEKKASSLGELSKKHGSKRARESLLRMGVSADGNHLLPLNNTAEQGTKTIKLAASKTLPQSQRTVIKNESFQDEDVNHIEEPFEFIGDLTSSYLNEPDQVSMSKDDTDQTDAALSSLSETLGVPLSSCPKIIIHQTDNSHKRLKYLPFYDYVDTLLKQLPEDRVQNLSKKFLDDIHVALSDQRKS